MACLSKGFEVVAALELDLKADVPFAWESIVQNTHSVATAHSGTCYNQTGEKMANLLNASQSHNAPAVSLAAASEPRQAQQERCLAADYLRQEMKGQMFVANALAVDEPRVDPWLRRVEGPQWQPHLE